GTVQLGCSTSNGVAAISVSDTGRGISPAEREAVFHPFYSRRGEGGTGLGLVVPADEVFGLDLAPPSVPRAIDEVGIGIWVDAGRAQTREPTRSGVAVQLIVDAQALAAVAEAVCDQAARVLSR